MVASCGLLAGLLGWRGTIGRREAVVLLALFAVATWLTL
jgi:hypothetical protein